MPTRAAKVEKIVRAMRVDGVHLLDYSLRCGPQPLGGDDCREPEAVVEAAVRGAGMAAKLIDLTRQNG